MSRVPPLSADAIAAGALAAEGKTQMEIASILNLSQAGVSRFLRLEAISQKIKIKRTFDWSGLAPELVEEARSKITNRRVGVQLESYAKLHRQAPPAVDVVSVGPSAEGEARSEAFGSGASHILINLLHEVRGTVGAAWGDTLWRTVQALPRLSKYQVEVPIEFVPLCGDPLIDATAKFADRTSSRLVIELNRIVNGDRLTPAWLGLVPAMIPRGIAEKDLEVMNRFIDLIPRYSAIFGPRSSGVSLSAAPIVDDLSMILTGAGPADRAIGFGNSPLGGLSPEDSATLSRNVFGDIGGVLLPRVRRRGQAPHEFVSDLISRWTGLQRATLEKCAAQSNAARSSSRPGVVLFSYGASRAEIVLEAVRQGLLNRLIIGSDLADAISSTLDASLRPK